MTDDEFRRLQDAADLVGYAADTDHYCEEEGCTFETPKCRERHLKRGFHELLAILEPPHEGLHPNRVRNNDAERIYAEEWIREQAKSPGISGGHSAIEHILWPEAEAAKAASVMGRECPPRITFRDAQVAASIVQWFGTNCGRCFIERCERRITEARAIRSEWERGSWDRVVTRPPAEDDQFTVRARMLCREIPGTRPYDHAVKTLAQAMRAMYEVGKLDGAAAQFEKQGANNGNG